MPGPPLGAKSGHPRATHGAPDEGSLTRAQTRESVSQRDLSSRFAFREATLSHKGAHTGRGCSVALVCQPKTQRELRAAAGEIFHRDGCCVIVRDAAHDRQPEARAVGALAVAAPEALEDQFALAVRDARAA